MRKMRIEDIFNRETWYIAGYKVYLPGELLWQYDVYMKDLAHYGQQRI